MNRPSTFRSALFGALALLLAGCGIRATSVAVDAGSAPSRASCTAPGEPDNRPSGPPRVRVYLICSAQLIPVNRDSGRSEDARSAGSRTELARVVIDQLQQQPTPGEEDAGFSTRVPEGLTVTGGSGTDPKGTLRLDRHPDELPRVALAQLVCSLARTSAANDRGVVTLGGPEPRAAPNTYQCTEEVRGHPDSV